MLITDDEQIVRFKEDTLQEARAAAQETGQGTGPSYLQIMAEYLGEADKMAEYIPSYYEGKSGRNKIRVDGYSFDDFDQTLTLVIADFDNGEERTISKTSAEKSFGYLSQFLNAAAKTNLYDEVEISLPYADLIEMIHDRITEIKRIQFYLITDASRSKNLVQLDPESFEGIQIEKQIWDPERIFTVCCSDEINDALEIDLNSYCEGGLPVLPLQSGPEDLYKSYIGVIPGEALAAIYDRYGSRILEGNVRSFLSTKVAVNKKIRNTILNEPKMFFAFNNGISVTASNVVLEQRNGSYFITHVNNLQIINGGQTTASLANAKRKDKADLSQIFVQVKLTEVDDATSVSDSDELIQKISRSSNSQNKVSDADFFASHPFHRQMEQCSRLVKAPAVKGAQFETTWFYERARGQYLQEQMKLSPAKKNQYLALNPKKQLIRKTDLAKVQNTWRMLPHVVSKGAQTNFMHFADYIDKQWTEDKDQFNEKYYQNTASLLLMFQFLETSIPKQDWYKGGYRANIITYTLALFHLLVQNQFRGKDFDLNKVWAKQEVPEDVQKVLIELAEMVLETLTAEDRGTSNVTQWSKREACWFEVKKIDYQLPEEIKSYLISSSEQRSQNRAAKKEQKIVDSINVQTVMVSHPNEFWVRLIRFIVENKLVKSDRDVTLLKKASKLPNVVLSPLESKKMYSYLNAAKEDGFQE